MRWVQQGRTTNSVIARHSHHVAVPLTYLLQQAVDDALGADWHAEALGLALDGAAGRAHIEGQDGGSRRSRQVDIRRRDGADARKQQLNPHLARTTWQGACVSSLVVLWDET